MPVTPTLGVRDRTPWPASLAKKVSFQFSERLCFKVLGPRAVEGAFGSSVL